MIFFRYKHRITIALAVFLRIHFSSIRIYIASGFTFRQTLLDS